MTAEVVILNREAVALAADSAVTVAGADGQKIFTSANKIFALSSCEPVGVMIYGAATILGVPWETIIKAYRSVLGPKSHPTLDGYAEDFFEYLRVSRPTFFPEPAQVDYVGRTAATVLQALRHEIDRRVADRLGKAGGIRDREIGAILRAAVDETLKGVNDSPQIEGLPSGFDEALAKRYRATVYTVIDHVFQNHRISTATRRKLLALTFGFVSRHVSALDPPTRTGLVLAGFGSTQVFPGVRSYLIDGMAADVMKMQLEDSTDISHDDTQAVVRAYAQGEMVFRFMEGVDPTYQEFVDQLIRELANGYAQTLVDGLTGVDDSQRDALRQKTAASADAFVDRAMQLMLTVRSKHFAEPVTHLVDLLPKDELAAMAESLVNLTSFKRRISWDAETVGGPIDVAVISRGDGLIWIKRKHYFEPSLNPHYFAARYGGASR